MRGSRVPISLEDLKRKKEQEEATESKPVFLSKAERRSRAIAERQAAVDAMKSGSPGVNSEARSSHNQVPSVSSYGGGYDAREVERIRKEKLGVLVLSKRKAVSGGTAQRTLTKVTHWDDSEDTSRDAYEAQWHHQSSSIKHGFGRGHVGGFASLDDDDGFQGGHGGHHGGHHSGHHPKRDEKSNVSSSSTPSSFSWSKKPLGDMTLRDWRIMREDFEIAVKGKGEIPNPLRNWKESSLPDWALKAIDDAGYIEPTAIQRQSIPIGLEGRDLIGLAETGSGKTAAFLLPLLVHIDKLKKDIKATSNGSSASMLADEESDDVKGPYAAVLAPTRELAMQIKNEADKFSQYADCRTVLLIGGEDESKQISALRQGADIVVATPGRLVQLLKDAWISLSQCRYVVLDEGDRMIDLGFEEQLLFILDSMPGADGNYASSTTTKSPFGRPSSQSKTSGSSATATIRNAERTTILFSATMPPPIEKIANKYLRSPVTIYVGDVGKAVERIRQNVEFTKTDNEKRNRLTSLLRYGPKPPIIIFLNHKASCDAIGKMIEKQGFRVSVLHSGKSQEAREAAISQFKQAQSDVLVATNVAGRGLDVKGVTHVINYDLPDNIQEYTHRIGRTGRAGLDGTATSFLSSTDDKILAPLKALLQKTNQKIPKELNDMLSHSSLRPVF